MSDPKGKSAQTFMDRMGTLVDILDGRAGLGDLAPFTEYLSMPENYNAPGGASQNYKRMGRFSRAVWEMLAEGPEADERIAQVLRFFESEERDGHLLTEQGCSTPHSGMHEGAALLVRMAAIIFGHAELERASGEWLANHLALCRACADRSGHVEMPGFRILGRPLSDVRDLIYRASTGQPQRFPRDDKLVTERYFVAARLALMLAQIPGGLPEPAPRLPKLWARMTVQRFPGGYLATMERPKKLDGKGLKQAVDWTLSRDGVNSFGRSWQTPPPEVRGVIETLRSPE